MTKRTPRVVRLPEPLPQGESILWRGGPRARPLAVHVFHVRLVAIYFAALLIWRGVTSWQDTGSLLEASVSVLWVSPLALAGLGLLGLFAYLVSRTTTYTITNRRLVFQFGVAFPMTLNLPFKQIGSAALKRHADGTGDIPVSLVGATKIAYLVLWPHARPWHLRRPEPMMRAVPEAASLAAILAGALKEFAATTGPDAEAASAAAPTSAVSPDRTDPDPPTGGVSDRPSAAA
ncbi:photosynthetic complex putative assembly protein PuhB [Rhodoplanes azumiensis]|uniref:Photosynthetic complex putative assembly protein PuhB n=1 Tax=Rhodoplanes azumiensis TaxID=1897628 RepID=A0ABW5ANA8_9BRAD